MPLHCDTLDGPVVAAAKKALETRNVKVILPWVPKKTESELTKAFKKALKVRAQGPEAGTSPTTGSTRPPYAYTGRAKARPTPASSPRASTGGPSSPRQIRR